MHTRTDKAELSLILMETFSPGKGVLQPQTPLSPPAPARTELSLGRTSWVTSDKSLTLSGPQSLYL